MATCEKCGNKYYSKECPHCKKIAWEKSINQNNKNENHKITIPRKKEKNNLSSKKHANFLIRLLATIIDALIIGLPITLIFNEYIADAISAIIIIALWIVWNGQTPGKKILNLKIVDANYEELDLITSIVRYIGYYINILTFFVGFAIIAFREDRRGLHDILAKTYVIHTDKEKTENENDTADKIFAIISIFSGTGIIITTALLYQQTKIHNEIIYGTNDEKIIKQKQKELREQNKKLIDEMNKANKQLENAFKKFNQEMEELKF